MLTEEEMVNNVWTYVRRVVAIVRPRKLIYLGIDGVAPRAKLNQQRARRFTSAREAKIKQQVEQKLKK